MTTETSPLKPADVGYGAEPRRTSLFAATCLLATFSTTSSNVMYPFTYGQLGTVGGPLFGVMLQGAMCALAILTCRIAHRLRCQTFGELGRALGGRPGEVLLRTSQQVNNALFMPVALVLSAEALREIGLVACSCYDDPTRPECGWWDCHVHSLLLVVLVAWPLLLLARDIGELRWTAFVSVGLIVVQTALLLAAAATQDPGGRQGPWATDPLPYTPLAPFGPGVDSRWFTVISAVGTLLYSFCPLFIAVEVMARMEEPSLMPQALCYSLGFNWLVYLPTGLVVSHYWGSSVPNPATIVVTGALGALANAILLYCTFLDFAIVGAVLNRELQAFWMPRFDRGWTLRNLPTWLLLTLPSLTFALVLCFSVPRLDSLTGLLNSLCIPTTMLFGFPSMLLLLRWRGRTSDLEAAPTGLGQAVPTGLGPKLASLAPAQPAELPPDAWADARHLSRHEAGTEAVLSLSAGWLPALVFGVAAGVVLLFAIFTETIYSVLAETNYDGNFFCSIVARR